MAGLGENHLSTATCLTQVFFESGEKRGEFNQPYQTSDAVEDR